MKLSSAIAAVVDRVKSPSIAGLQAEGFDGREEREDITARARAGGTWARVVILGSTSIGEYDKIKLNVQFAAFLSLPFRPHPAPQPWAVMVDLTGAFMARLLNVVDWPDDMGKPTSLRSQNLYRLGDTKMGIARALVQWVQRVDVELVPEPVDLPPLELIAHEQHHVNDEETPSPAIITNIEIEQ